MTTVVLAEDHHIVRQGLKALLANETSIRLLGEAADGLAAIELVARHHPDVLLLDLMIPRLHGLEVIRQLHREHPDTRVIVLSMHADEPYVVEALRSGALGYVLKNCASSNLVEAIRRVADGRRYLSPALEERALESYFQNPAEAGIDPYETLTGRERVVLQLAAEGLSNPDLARKLFISPRTAESHRANLMRKLSLRSQTDLVRYAIRRKIITA
ncbi:MAG TPA: DNA-binding response regulator [Verrucomicrobiales bacterium]|nr:DNA-binding response regulator [Verrucomicrobiales bacterium]